MAHAILRLMSAFWYGLVFGVILPVTVILVSVTLDAELKIRWDIGLYWSWVLVAAGTLFLLTSGFLMLLSALALHHEGKGFPWSFGSHAAFNPQKLVTSGPYRMVRHPMATSYLLFLAGIGCLVPSLVMLLWMVPLTAGLFYEYFEFTEEKRLRHWFGQDYDRYHQRTPSLLPRLSSLLAVLGK
jgi:protein-S-isoprenylcysteine O-methyltransferase Ste14